MNKLRLMIAGAVALSLASCFVWFSPADSVTKEQVNTDSAQTLSNKTLVSPVITGSVTGGATFDAPVLSGPVLANPIFSGTTAGVHTYTLSTFAGTALGTYTLAGTPTITAPTISGPTFSGTASGTYTLASPTISGVLGGTALTIKRKSADESVNTTTTLQDDNDLTVAIGANEEWAGTLYASVGSNTNLTGLKVAFTSPSGSSILYTAIIAGNVANNVIGGNGVASGTAIDATTTVLTGSNNCNVVAHVWVLNGGTPGNVTFQWTQSTSNGANTTVRKGSMLQVRRIL